MRYRVYMSLEIEARGDREADQNALKLSELFNELLKSPIVQMTVQSNGLQISDKAIVHRPERAT